MNLLNRLTNLDIFTRSGISFTEDNYLYRLREWIILSTESQSLYRQKINYDKLRRCFTLMAIPDREDCDDMWRAQLAAISEDAISPDGVKFYREMRKASQLIKKDLIEIKIFSMYLYQDLLFIPDSIKKKLLCKNLI